MRRRRSALVVTDLCHRLSSAPRPPVGAGACRRDHAGRASDGNSRYEPQADRSAEFRAFDFTHDRRPHEVFRGGSGPAVLVLHEIPGLHPGVIDFARRLIAAGYSVYLLSLYGGPAAPAKGREIAPSILRVCVAREFTKLADRTSTVGGWLRALAASAYRECGGRGSA
jgi:hypothetical protein